MFKKQNARLNSKGNIGRLPDAESLKNSMAPCPPICLLQRVTFIIMDSMKLNNVAVLFFDLDNTLFDHTRAERATLLQLLRAEPESFAAIDAANFLELFHKHNATLWQQMSEGLVSPEELKVFRFEWTLRDLGLTYPSCKELSARYLQRYATQTFALPNMLEVLEYLAPRYDLGILSNGFTEIQEQKIANIGIGSYFKYRIFSGAVGALKPAPKIFAAATRAAGVEAPNALYIGDSYKSDIIGAKSAGWRAVFFNPSGEVITDSIADVEIFHLQELMDLL